MDSPTPTLVDAQQRISELEAEVLALRQANQQLDSEFGLKERLDLAIQSGNFGLWEWHVPTGDVLWDETMCKIYGIRDEQKPVTFELWREHLHEEDRERAVSEIQSSVRNHRPFTSRFRIYRSLDPGDVRYIRVNAHCHYDNHGAPSRMVGFNWDMTDKAETERRNAELQEQLQQAQKLEAMGTLAGGVAHDFNNMLGAIIGYTELMMRTTEGSKPEMASMLDKVLTASLRARELISQILVFSRQEEVCEKMMNLEEVVKEAIDFLRHSLPSSIHIKEELKDVGCIHGNPTQINQIVLNLVTNASQALPDLKGKVEISLEKENILYPVESIGLVPGEYAVIKVCDSGVGMPPDVQARVFDPFFTTKEVGKGTGLGLSVVHGIVTQHAGGINLESELGQGSCFTIYWPLADREAVASKNKEEESRLVGMNEHIVILDDEVALLSMHQLFLESSGYRVTAFTSSPDARNYLLEHRSDVDLIITDQVMPDLTGSEIIEELRGLGDRTPVILTTGFGFKMDPAQVISLGWVRILKKPCSLNELSSAIENGLHS